MYRYLLNEGSFYLPDVGAYQSYGLNVVAEEAGAETLLSVIQDISVDRAFVEALAQTFEQQQLEPIHLPDVLEDVL